MQERIARLKSSRAVDFYVNAFLVALVASWVGEPLSFLKNFQLGPGVATVYVIGMCLTTITMYGGLLLIPMTMCALLSRLDEIEVDVETVLHRDKRATYGSIETGEINVDLSEKCSQWTQAYSMIRHDAHTVSDKFGTIMIVGLFVFIVDTTSLIALVWEELGPDMAISDVIALLLGYSSNAVVLVLTYYSIAFLVTKCEHYIGPSLAILSSQNANVPQLLAVTNMFLHAPIRIHVGNFEVGPEHANAVALWFVGLFLVVFGLKMPGVE